MHLYVDVYVLFVAERFMMFGTPCVCLASLGCVPVNDWWLKLFLELPLRCLYRSNRAARQQGLASSCLPIWGVVEFRGLWLLQICRHSVGEYLPIIHSAFCSPTAENRD